MENKGLQHTTVVPTEYSPKMLEHMTDNFSELRIIGRGGFGVVYKGVLSNGEVIAVKKLYNDPEEIGATQFKNEIIKLMGAQHQNIVRLVGYCYNTRHVLDEYEGKHVFADSAERAICLEYMEGGSLEAHLTDESCGLEWHVRYQIIKGICGGLKYLHTGSKNPICHLDLKPANILLDRNMIPKIGDFGISRLVDSMKTCVTKTALTGTRGYMPPEYILSQQMSPKSDIFSLGVIMIHIIAGREGYQHSLDMPSEQFIAHVHENWRKQLQATTSSHKLEQVKTCTEIALTCVEYERANRPTITEIVSKLKNIDDQGHTLGGMKEQASSRSGGFLLDPRTGSPSTHSSAGFGEQLDGRLWYEPSFGLTTGAMVALLPKLEELHTLNDKYNLDVEMQKDIKFLYNDLITYMQITLSSVADVWRDQLDDDVKLWAKELRNLSYHTENIIDSLLVRLMVFQPDIKVDSADLIRDSREAIQRILSNMQDLNARCNCHEVSQIVVNRTATLADDPRSSALNKDLEEMVGIEVSIEEVIGMLELADTEDKKHTKELHDRVQEGTSLGVLEELSEIKRRVQEESDDLDEDSRIFHPPNIVSITGMAGLGKTTIAKAVYHSLEERFDCRAFVSVSRDPNIAQVFREILFQIDKQKYMHINTATLNIRMLLHELRALLANKRYFIVIDDLWDRHAWDTIKFALIGRKNGSKVLTTTRNFDVAARVGHVYQLKEISRWHSEKLFKNRFFEGKGKSPNDSIEIPEKLLQKCGGVPLAIITMASLLAEKPRDDWSEVYNSIGFGCGGNEDVENMRKILLLSYYDLPAYLRTCLLHLNMFPGDYSIRKETLIWMWMAEGFVGKEGNTNLYELGERYFKELVNRSLIIPVEDFWGCTINGCRVHELVLDMISALSTEENFVTVLDGNRQHNPTEGMAHRLAVRETSMEQHEPLDKKRTEHVRSFNTIKSHFGMMLSLSRFEALRVLSMEECTFMEYHLYDLKHLGKLLQLRYLGLYNTPIIELPKEVGDLHYLQTLDLRGTCVRELPFSVSRLSQLKCLRADENTRVPDWIGNLTSLESLQLEDVGKSVNFVTEVGKLKELRELNFSIEGLDKSSNTALVESLRHLNKIRVLRLTSSRSVEEANWQSYVAPPQLRELCLAIAFSGLPKWINASFVPYLSHLYVNMEALDEEDVVMLGDLQCLISLEILMLSNVFLSIKGEGLFWKLRCFYTSAPFRFLLGAMPALEFLHFEVDVRAFKRAGFALDDIASFENLLRLRTVEVEINSRGAHAVHVIEAEEAVKRTVDNHPNNPNASIRRI